MFVHNVAPVYYLLPAHHHAACRRYAAEQVAALCLVALLVVYKVRFYVVVEVAFLEYLSLLGKPFVHEKELICRHRGEDIGDAGALRVGSVHNPYHVRRVLVYLVVFRSVHYSRLVDAVQSVGYYFQIVRRKPRYAVAEIVPQLLELSLLHVLVVVVVRLIVCEHRVFLLFYYLIGLVDGEVELCYERTVHPRLADVVAVVLAFGPRQRPHYYKYGHGNERNAYYYVTEVFPSVFVLYVHNGCINLFPLRK